MQRFGRSAQLKKDGWGGSFILVAILVLAGAYYIGNWFSGNINGNKTASDSPIGIADGGAGGSAAMAEPHSFQLYFVQAGAFRSESSARKLASTLTEQNYPAMVTGKDQAGYNHVYAGVYTSAETATNVRTKLVADGLTEGAFTYTVPVNFTEETVAATSAANKGDDSRSALQALNQYLYEGAVWLESRATNGTATPTEITTLGQKLGGLAAKMSGSTDQKASKLAKMVGDASVNAKDMETAASAGLSGSEFQKATSGYLSLLKAYRDLQAGQ
ncbi:MAG: SPOR domain-containing protein [Mycobacterium leprae]